MTRELGRNELKGLESELKDTISLKPRRAPKLRSDPPTGKRKPPRRSRKALDAPTENDNPLEPEHAALIAQPDSDRSISINSLPSTEEPPLSPIGPSTGAPSTNSTSMTTLSGMSQQALESVRESVELNLGRKTPRVEIAGNTNQKELSTIGTTHASTPGFLNSLAISGQLAFTALKNAPCLPLNSRRGSVANRLSPFSFPLR